MPKNLHQGFRYRVIDRCLRNRNRSWGWRELSEACWQALQEELGIDKRPSRRTIMLDISRMRSGKLGYEAPIEYDRKEKSYYYSNSKFSIENIPLRKSDLEELRNALLILQQFSGRESLNHLQEVVTKLEDTLYSQPAKTSEIILFEHSLNKQGQKWINPIYQAIKNQQALSITYQPFHASLTSFVFSPYLLKEYNNRWFVFGFHHIDQSIYNPALDRIVSLQKSLQAYQGNPHFDGRQYLKDIVGVTLLEKKIKVQVEIKVFGLQAKYIATKPIHESQKKDRSGENYTIFLLNLIPNYELESRLLSYGEDLEVLKPKSLRQRMAARVADMQKRYK